jgi:hypothetical protein
MEKRIEEWLRQADYDMDTAEYMWLGRRYIHEDLSLAQKNYPEHIVKNILAGGKEIIAWIRGLF